MLLLTSVSDVLRVTTGSAVSSIEVHTSWVDKIGTTDSLPDRQNTLITTATTTNIVPAPAVGVQRNVRFVSVMNDSAVVCTVTIEHFNGTAVSIYKYDLQAGTTLQYTTAKGFEILASSTQSQYVPPVSVSNILLIRASAATQLAGSYGSTWRVGTFPAIGAIPTTAAVCSDATLGALPLPVRTGVQKRLFTGMNVSYANVSATGVVVDRLAHMGGLSGTVATAQTVGVDVTLATSNLVARKGAADYSEVQWFMEWYTATGATIASPSFAVTHFDGTTGTAQIFNGGSVNLPASVAASRMYRIIATSGKPIRSIQTMTMPTTGTAGNIGVTAYRGIASSVGVVANRVEPISVKVQDAIEVPDNACLNMIVLCSATTTGVIQGTVQMTVVA